MHHTPWSKSQISKPCYIMCLSSFCIHSISIAHILLRSTKNTQPTFTLLIHCLCLCFIWESKNLIVPTIQPSSLFLPSNQVTLKPTELSCLIHFRILWNQRIENLGHCCSMFRELRSFSLLSQLLFLPLSFRIFERDQDMDKIYIYIEYI